MRQQRTPSLSQIEDAVDQSAGQVTLIPLTRSVSAQGKGDDVRYFALFYDVVDGFAERRAPYREAHLSLAQEAHCREEILLAGALGMPPDRALIVFRAGDRSIAEPSPAPIPTSSTAS